MDMAQALQELRNGATVWRAEWDEGDVCPILTMGVDEHGNEDIVESWPKSRPGVVPGQPGENPTSWGPEQKDFLATDWISAPSRPVRSAESVPEPTVPTPRAPEPRAVDDDALAVIGDYLRAVHGNDVSWHMVMQEQTPGHCTLLVRFFTETRQNTALKSVILGRLSAMFVSLSPLGVQWQVKELM